MDAPVVRGRRLGLVVGHSIGLHASVDLGSDPASDPGGSADRPGEFHVATSAGPVELHDIGSAILLDRHHATPEGFRPAHLIDHHRHLAALCVAGCDRVLAIGSVGSLRTWPVGTVMSPFDLYAPQVNPTWFSDARGHQIPGFDTAWRDTVLATWAGATTTPLLDGGVYAQTNGPRFETPAEVRALAVHADVVGMTLASECVLAGEIGLAYAAVCVVDNLANGVGRGELTLEQFHEGVARNQARLLSDLRAVLPHLAAGADPSKDPIEEV